MIKTFWWHHFTDRKWEREEGEQKKISKCFRWRSVKIPQHLNEVLLWFAFTTSFNLNKSTNFRILRLGLNSFPLSPRSPRSLVRIRYAPIGIYNHLNSFIKLPRCFVSPPVSRTDPAFLHVKNVNTFSMGKLVCTFNSRRARSIFIHDDDGAKKKSAPNFWRQ